MSFKEKTALITGGSRGIGRAVANRLAKGGANIIVTATTSKIEEVAAEIAETYGVKAIGVAGDISNEQDVKALFEIIRKEFPTLDICVNNAGISIDNLTMRMSVEEFDSVIQTNLRSVFLVSKEAMGLMWKRYGRIVNMSSIIGIRGNIAQPAYAASKAAIIGLTKTMANETAARKITVNAVAPGLIETDMTKALSDKVKDDYIRSIPMKKFGGVEDVAAAVAFLASEDAGYITGQVVAVDGGMLLT